MTEHEILIFLGLMKKAGKLSVGEEASRMAARSGKAVLFLLASDASSNAVRRAADFSVLAHCPVLELTADKTALSDALGCAPFSIAAVTDRGFASALWNKLDQPQNHKAHTSRN